MQRTLSNSTAGIYTYEFKANDGFGDSEARWFLTLETRDVVPANVKFYLGQDNNYKTNGNIMPVLELYKTAGLDENQYDYVGWFQKDGKTEYVYNPQDYTIIEQNKGNRELFLMNADGSDNVKLTSSPKSESNARWLNDSEIIYMRGGKLYTAKVEGNALKNEKGITGAEGMESFELSPAGDKIMFIKPIKALRGRKIAADEFSFKISDANGVIATVKNKADERVAPFPKPSAKADNCRQKVHRHSSDRYWGYCCQRAYAPSARGAYRV